MQHNFLTKPNNTHYEKTDNSYFCIFGASYDAGLVREPARDNRNDDASDYDKCGGYAHAAVGTVATVTTVHGWEYRRRPISRQRQGKTSGTTWEPRTTWERSTDRECRRKKSTAFHDINCTFARSRSSDRPTRGAPIRACDYSHRIAVDRVSFGEDCVSLGKHYPRDHGSNSAFGSGADHRAAQVR